MKMMEQGEARCVYVMVTFEDSPYFGSLFEVKLDGQGGVTQEPPQLLKPVARFVAEKLSVHAVWNYCTMGSTKLYLLPDSGPDAQREVPSLKGYMLDVKTRRFVSSIKPPNAPKWFGRAVAADGNIYLLVDPLFSTDAPEPSFERYDPIKDSWTSLCSFPYSGRFGEKEILGNAVCDGIILFNVRGSGSEELWAYDVIENVWHPVQVKNMDCYSFRGTAVVVEKTIYALSTFPGVIVAFSIRREDQTDEGHVVTCSLGSLLYSKELLNHSPYNSTTECIVHLGKHEFCVVQTGSNDQVDNDCQGLKITTFQIVGGSEIEIIHSTVYEVELGDSESLDVEFCFTPDCEDIVPTKEEEIATPLNRLKLQEEEETGAVTFYLTPECEDMEAEEYM